MCRLTAETGAPASFWTTNFPDSIFSLSRRTAQTPTHDTRLWYFRSTVRLGEVWASFTFPWSAVCTCQILLDTYFYILSDRQKVKADFLKYKRFGFWWQVNICYQVNQSGIKVSICLLLLYNLNFNWRWLSDKCQLFLAHISGHLHCTFTPRLLS